ncbi:MAG: type I-C CRISPR-associated protein Cas8c/Csd1 [Eubacteriales bacterium]
MILQALVRYYEDLAAKDKIAAPGWNLQKVSYGLCLSDSGEIIQTLTLKEEVPKGTKKILLPQKIKVPSPVKRASGIAANFLCDNSGYILGVDTKGKPERTADCYKACRELHETILENVETPAAKAVLAFFKNWKPENASENPALTDVWDELISGVNLIFYYNMLPVHDDPAIRQAWQAHYQTDSGGPVMTCLVTGKTGPVEAVHPSIKGVIGAQSAGAALVSFNAPAFCSYGKEQNLNAPTGKYAAFAYTSALNYLISDTQHTVRIGDTTVLFWAEGAEEAYQGLFGGMFNGSSKRYSEAELWEKTKKLLSGEKVEYDETLLSPDRTFYILGISPNAARLSVRFFLRNTFGSFLENIKNHYDRMEIARTAYDQFDTIPIWRMLQETVNLNSRDKSPSANMSGAVLQSVLTDTLYPATLLNGVTLRIRADREINRERAAIIKAYYLKNENKEVPKEVLTVSLNRETDYIPYCLGRLFALYEDIQSAANPGINSTIKDKYFNSASASPAVIFPTLDNLSKNHLKKIRGDKPGLAVFYEKQILEITDKLPIRYPARMTLPEQGSFQLGYYHQVAARFTKKQEENENV